MFTDTFGNAIEEGKWVSVELAEPVRVAKGQVASIEQGSTSTLRVPGGEPKSRPTVVTVMVALQILMGPNDKISPNMSVLMPPVEAKAEATEEQAEADDHTKIAIPDKGLKVKHGKRI